MLAKRSQASSVGGFELDVPGTYTSRLGRNTEIGVTKIRYFVRGDANAVFEQPNRTGPEKTHPERPAGRHHGHLRRHRGCLRVAANHDPGVPTRRELQSQRHLAY